MEKTDQKKLLIQHFSHEHLLEHRLLPDERNTCFGCKVEIFPGKHCYKCKTCPFYLHQVCYNMPEKVQHPVDPNHHLTLFAMPLSTDKSIKCEACQQPITGFYYNSATCGNFYHILCLATPLFVKLPVHPHRLKLEFSPPYKFKCDLCDRPSHGGWLYRCGLCEFDVHISCAIMDSQAKLQLLPQTRSYDLDGRTDADTKHQEVMALLLQGITGTQNQSEQQDQLTPMSDYTSSFQFSDACFSIDIEQSFKNYGPPSEEADSHLVKVQEPTGTKRIDFVVETKGIVHDPKQANPAIAITKNPLLDPYIGIPPKVQNIAISPAIGSHVWMELDEENKPTKVKTSNDSAGLIHQTKKSDSVRFKCSCW